MKLLTEIFGAGPLAIACTFLGMTGCVAYGLNLAPVAEVHHVEHHGVNELEIETRFR